MRSPKTIARRFSSVTAILAIALAGACDNPAEPIEGGGDPENISRVTVRLTPTTGAVQTSVRVDPDGTTLPQPVGAAQGVLALVKGMTYSGTITLLNDLDSRNVIDITKEVRNEANFHRFFYTLTCAGVTVPDAGLDLDTQSPTKYPVGLNFQLVVAASAPTTSNCTLHVELHHFEGTKGNGLGTVFDTDLSLDFPVTVN